LHLNDVFAVTLPTTMHLFRHKERRLLGQFLVVLQFGLLAVLVALAAQTFSLARLPIESIALAVASIALAVWTLMHNRLGNFNIQPIPTDWGLLVTSGPYHWIRHPMYSAVLLGAAALTLMTEPAVGWALWGALAVVLLVKAIIEERWMKEKHSGYAGYIRETTRFIPWLL
jgi:protein-S-isoprenylcysteine O-methyltransferase Ste14